MTNSNRNAQAATIASDFARADLAAEQIAQRCAELFKDVTEQADHDALVEVLRANYQTERGCNEDAAKRAVNRLKLAANVTRPKATSKAAVERDAQRKATTPESVREQAAEAREKAAKAKAQGNTATAMKHEGRAGELEAKATALEVTARAKAEKEQTAEIKAELKTPFDNLVAKARKDVNLQAMLVWVEANADKVTALMVKANDDRLSIIAKGGMTDAARPSPAKPTAAAPKRKQA